MLLCSSQPQVSKMAAGDKAPAIPDIQVSFHNDWVPVMARITPRSLEDPVVKEAARLPVRLQSDQQSACHTWHA